MTDWRQFPHKAVRMVKQFFSVQEWYRYSIKEVYRFSGQNFLSKAFRINFRGRHLPILLTVKANAMGSCKIRAPNGIKIQFQKCIAQNV